MITNLPNNYLAVKVPKGARSIHIDQVLAPNKVLYKYPDCQTDEWGCENIPEGQYTLVGMASDFHREQMKAIVGNGLWDKGEEQYYWTDYTNKNNEVGSPGECFKSLLRSLDLNPEEIIIIKKEK